VAISPCACVIDDEKPVFLGVSEILKRSVEKTVQLLQRELEIKLGELEQQWHWDSLERISSRSASTAVSRNRRLGSVLAEIREGLKPFAKQLAAR